MALTAELLLDARATLGEGALWYAPNQVLHWIDIDEGEVHTFDPATGQDVVRGLGQPVGTIVRRKRGGAIVALRDGIAALDLDSGDLAMIRPLEPGDPPCRFNDGKCDPAGRFWAGTMPTTDLKPVAGLYCLYPDHTLKRMLDRVTISNGIVWTDDKRTMYYIDSIDHRVDAFDYDNDSGAISRRRTVVNIPHDLGYPDGSALDAEGMLWVAQFGSGTVNRWDPASGNLLQRIAVPAPMATACAFGGPALDQLYITTARLTMDEASLRRCPQAGGVFVAEPGVVGVESYEFAG